MNAMRKDMLKMINFERARAGISPLTLGRNPSPQAHAEYMRDNCTVSHTGSGGTRPSDRWARSGGNAYYGIGENVNGYRGCSFTVPRSRTLYYYVEKLMDSLMDSPGHRENILDRDYDEVRLGFAINPYGMWLTQIFVDLQ